MKLSRRDVLSGLGVSAALMPVRSGARTAADAGTVSGPIRIAVMAFVHETVTFLPYDTTTEDFIYEGSPTRGEALLSSSPRSYIGGFVKVAREYADVEVVGIESPLSPITGTGSGWITNEAFTYFVDRMMADLDEQGPFDGAYLCLHGAMGVRDVARPESVIASRVRDVIGPSGFIVGTFDPHGNEDEEFLRYADLAFCSKYFPHYDSYLQGERAARALIRCIRGDYKPASATAKPPIITPSVVQWTGQAPWMDLVQRALVWEARTPDVFVSLYYGFAFMDAIDAGMTFQVMTNSDPELAKHIAEDMARTAWRWREQLVGGTRVFRMAEGVELAKDAMTKGATPIVLADHSDRSGAATWLLDQVIKQELSNTVICTVTDRQVIDSLRRRNVKAGDVFDMHVGGRLDPSAGDPVRVVGKVHAVSGSIYRDDLQSGGPQLWVSVSFGNNNVLVISPYLHQLTEPGAIARIGLDPAQFKVFAIKSRVHFRRGFYDSGFAKTILLVEPEEPFLGTIRLDALPYKHLDLEKFYPYGKDIRYNP